MPVIRTDGIAWAPETPAARHAIAARLAKDPTACAAAPPSARLALVLARLEYVNKFYSEHFFLK